MDVHTHTNTHTQRTNHHVDMNDQWPEHLVTPLIGLNVVCNGESEDVTVSLYLPSLPLFVISLVFCLGNDCRDVFNDGL